MTPVMPLELAVSTVASMFCIAVLHALLWRNEAKSYLLWWAAAWAAFGLRYSPALLGIRLQVPGPMIEFASVRDICFIMGAALYVGKPRWQWFVLAPLFELFVLVSGLGDSPAWLRVWIPGRPAFSAACAMLMCASLLMVKAPAPVARRLAALGYLVYAVNTGLSSFALFYELRFLVDQLGYFAAGIGLALAELQAAGDARAASYAMLSSAMAVVLRGHVAVCSRCHRIEQQSGGWESPARLVSAQTNAPITHGICPDCLTTHFGEPTDAELRS